MAKIESTPIVEDKMEVETKGKSFKIWILIGALVLIVVGCGVAFFAYPYLKGTEQASEQKREGNIPEGSEVQNHRLEKVKATLELEPFLVNLADKEDTRYLKTTFQLGLADDPGKESENPIVIAAIRDSIISLLSSKTADQILTPEGKNKLREEVREHVNSISPQIRALEVYIVDFVVQL